MDGPPPPRRIKREDRSMDDDDDEIDFELAILRMKKIHMQKEHKLRMETLRLEKECRLKEIIKLDLEIEVLKRT